VVLLEQIQGPQRLDAGCTLGRIGKLASGSCVFIDGNSRVGRMCCLGRSLGMVMCLDPVWSLYSRDDTVSVRLTLIRGAASMMSAIGRFWSSPRPVGWIHSTSHVFG